MPRDGCASTSAADALTDSVMQERWATFPTPPFPSLLLTIFDQKSVFFAWAELGQTQAEYQADRGGASASID